VLGHITTFGGHPVCCAAGMAAMKVLLKNELINDIPEKEQLFRELLSHKQIKAVRSRGLLMAVELDSHERVLKVVKNCIDRSVLTDWFLFAPHCLRIAPPLTITRKEIQKAVKIIISAMDTD